MTLFSAGRTWLIAASCTVVLAPAVSATVGPCELGPISYVFIDNHSIFDTHEESPRRFSWFYRTANKLHASTRRSVITRELLFGPGDCYEPLLVEESERLLRRYSFLAQVEIYGVPQPDGSYHVVVETRDEWSTQADLRVALRDGLAFEGVRLREANLFGRGETIEGFYIDRDVTRDYGVSFFTPQFSGTRWDMEGVLGRTRAGTTFTQSVAYPFVGEVSRWAARQQFSREDRFFDYVADDTGTARLHVLMPVRDKRFDLAIVTRLGRRGNLTLVGAALSHHQLTYPGSPQVARRNQIDTLRAQDSLTVRPALQLREELSSIRFGIVLGQRNVWWVKRRGLDSMHGEQDVELGADLGLSIARSIPSLEADNDVFTSLQFYSGLEFGNLLLAGRSRLDARRDFDAPAGQSEWEDVYTENELLLYWRPERFQRHTAVLRGSGTGGWNTRTPFQLTLGGDRSLRGYRPDRFPGGRRLVVSVEDRMYWGWPWRETLDLGSTLFVDAGRIWPGGAPYGRDSGWRATAGFGLRASFPPGSRTTYRVDFAWPIQPNANARDLRLMISVGEQLGLGAQFGDWQVTRSRYEGAATKLFRFRP